MAQGTSASDSTSIRPSGVRTATAQTETPRIITPSSTAWPPTGASRLATRAPSGIRSGSPPLAEEEDWDACAEPTGGLTAYFPTLCLAARRWKRSTRPPVSTSFCLPV